MKKNFFWKSFVSFSLVWSFLFIFISGIVLYIAPSGKISNWTNWTLAGFSKAEWQSVHTIFSYTFVVLSFFHLVMLNWRVFLSYWTAKAVSGISRRKELFYSVVLTVVVFLGTYFQVQPFKAVMDFGEWTTESWESNEKVPPIPHAEILTIRELSDKYINMPADSILQRIRQKGFVADSIGQTLGSIGLTNKRSPAEIYAAILPDNNAKLIKEGSVSPIQGLGKKTLLDISADLGKDVNGVLEILKTKNIHANKNEKIREIAERAGMTPMEVLEIIR